MIELHDISSDESLDATASINMSCSLPKICASLNKYSSNNIIYDSSNIKRFLKEQPEKYTLVNNDKIITSSAHPVDSLTLF